MDKRVVELHCIMPIENIPSVLEHGILSHRGVSKLDHQSVAMETIQERRSKVQVPGGRRLHQYANLYFHARNPMLYVRSSLNNAVCVLTISTDVLGLEGVVLADQNASSDYVRFYSPKQWGLLDYDAIFALDWTDPHPPAYFRKKSRKCAEVLVPDRVHPKYFTGAKVASHTAQSALITQGFDLPIYIEQDFFF